MPTILLAALMLAPDTNMSLAQPLEGAQIVSAAWSCAPRKTCGKIGSCEEAVWYLRNCSWGYRLDGDSDGVPCETICGHH